MPIVRLGQSLCERVEVTKNGGFHSDPIAADGFGVDSFTDTRADPSWRISSIKQSHDLARHFELPPSATGPVKFWGRPDRYCPVYGHLTPRPLALAGTPRHEARGAETPPCSHAGTAPGMTLRHFRRSCDLSSPCGRLPARRPPMAAENCCQTARRSASARSPRRVNEYTRRCRPDSAVTQRLTSRPACSRRCSAG